MERQLSVWRVMRRICTVILVLILLVACSAQVHAEGENTAGEDVLTAMSEDAVEETGLTEENFAAVAAQLSAVARADGRSSADRMIDSAFSEAAALQVSEAAPVTAAAESSVNVIVVPEAKTVARSVPTSRSSKVTVSGEVRSAAATKMLMPDITLSSITTAKSRER